MQITIELIREIEKYVTDLIEGESSEDLTYHTIDHTKSVVKNAKLIGVKENLNKNDMNILLTSAWFHDTGYIKKSQGHEKDSVTIAVNFLELNTIDKNVIALVSDCIMATAFPQQPTNKIAEILCDADIMHLSDKNYFEIAEKLRQELNNTGNHKIKRLKFEKESLLFFRKHTFFTNYCQVELSNAKEKNAILLEESILKKENKKMKSTKKQRKYSRGVDSMFKLTARNQINLSAIADNKSNILISLNGIIISLGLAGLASNYNNEPALIWPIMIFIIFSLSTIILAILSTRPTVPKGKFTQDDIKQQKVNLLFFGNFFNMELDEYEWAINEMIDNDLYLYATMTKDQYSLGKILAKKYKLLRWAYNVFMVGLIVSVISFLVVFRFF